MNYFDAHTHTPSTLPTAEVMYNISCETASIEKMRQELPNSFYTMGVHPCSVQSANWYVQINCLERALSQHCLAAIGECGFDRRASLDLSSQQQLFLRQVAFAKRYSLPLIVHCVRAYDLLLAQKKELGTLPVLLHGYRGGEGLTLQLLRETDWFFSIGEKFNPLSLQKIPFNRLFIESDTSEKGIVPIYDKIATQLHLSLTELSQIISENKKRFFLVTNRI